jgi:hypothetical protein
MISWQDYRNPTDRIAGALLEAIRPWRKRFAQPELQLTRRQVAVIQQLTVRLARQTAQQGLAPVDLDVPNGLAALEAIATAIFSIRLRGGSIDGRIGPMEAALRAALPAEWKHVVDAADRIVDNAVRMKLQEI